MRKGKTLCEVLTGFKPNMPSKPIISCAKCAHPENVHVLGICFSPSCPCQEFTLPPVQHSEPLHHEGETFIACRFIGEGSPPGLQDHWFKLQGASDEREPEFPEIESSEIVWIG